MIRKFLNMLYKRSYTSSSKKYIQYLRKKGVNIGNGTIFIDPKSVQIDITRPELLEIGNNVLIHRGTVLMTHDFASRAFITKYNEFIPSHKKITIGNNVWLGENVTILKGVSIGDNVIIGYGAVVTKSIPSNAVAVGFPAKVISTFDDYFTKRKEQYVEEVVEYALCILNTGRELSIDDFYDDYPVFVDGNNYQDYNYPYFRVFTKEQFEIWKKEHHAIFSGFDDFVSYVKRKQNTFSCTPK